MGWEEIYDQAHARVRFEAGLEFGCLGAKGWDGAGWPLSCYYYSYNYYSATTSTDQYRDSTERQFRHSVEEGEEEDGRL